jgi:pSer/pThr/pTyr-binding forkhead associated (FHA) protein
LPLRFRIRPPSTAGAPAPVERTVDVTFARGSMVLGRRAGIDIELPFGAVSGLHARIERAPAGWSVIDLGSANGTYVGDRRLVRGEACPLRVGETLRLANVTLVFEGEHATGKNTAVRPETTASLARRLVSDLFGAAHPAEVARLVVESGPSAGRAMAFASPGKRYTVGRAPTCDLVLPDDDVSREHATFERRWDGVEVRDLGSKNGVEIGGDRIEGERRLADGEVLVMGNTRLRFEDPEDRYLRNMQDEAARAGATVVPRGEVVTEEPVEPPRRKSGAPLLVGAVALVVLVAIGALVVWFLLGSWQ